MPPKENTVNWGNGTPTSQAPKSHRSILYIHDTFGYKLANAQLLAGPLLS